MRRRKSARERRIARRRNRILAKWFFTRIAFPITIFTIGGAYFKSKGLFDDINLKDFWLPSIEGSYETPTPEVTPELIPTSTPEPTEPVREVMIRDEINEKLKIEVPEEVEPEEIISTDLLDMGYEFKTDIDFEELLNQNPDTVGWIHIDGTNVDYRIMHGKDKEYDYYAHHDVDGNYVKKRGCIYLDKNNYSFEKPIYELDDLTFIYGHHTNTNEMFSQICKYKEQEFYDEYPFFVIYTPYDFAYKADIFAGAIYKGNDVSVYNEHYNFVDEQDFIDYMDCLKEKSLITSDLSVEYGDKIVALVTCTYENGSNGNLRFIVFARLSKQYINELQREEGPHLGLHN